MIFDCNETTKLLMEWKKTKDSSTLEQVLKNSKSLIEAVVSGYPYTMREDLIQETYLRLCKYSLEKFDPARSNLYNYLTSVINNICRTYVKKEYKNYDELEVSTIFPSDEKKSSDKILTSLIIRNRERFSSIDVNVIDSISSYIYRQLSGVGEKRVGVVSELMEMFDLNRSQAAVVYHSTIFWLRINYIDYSKEIDLKDREFSLIVDLEELVGENIFEMISKAFSGMYIKFP